MGIRKLIVESDSEQAVRWVVNKGSSLCLLGLVYECQRLLRRQWEVKVKHIYREANCVADFMAAEAL